MRISDWSSDVCSSDLAGLDFLPRQGLDDQAAQCRREREAEEIARGRAGEYAEACCAAGEDRDTRRADRDVEQDGQEAADGAEGRSEEHTSELQSLMRISYAVFCLKKKKNLNQQHIQT